MPIRPELRHFYRGQAWRATRERIRARAGDCCEQCGKPNGVAVWVYRAWDAQYWSPGMGISQYWITCLTGERAWVLHKNGRRGFRFTVAQVSASIKLGTLRAIRVVLTLAHLNHVAGDDRDENLKLLCQWCHLNYDKLHHHETRAERKDRARPLLVGGA